MALASSAVIFLAVFISTILGDSIEAEAKLSGAKAKLGV